MSQIWNNLTKFRDSILLYWFSKNRGSLELWYIKQEKKCFITRWNTTKRVENTTRSGVFLKILRGVSSGLVMKHYVQCFILLFNQNDFKRRNEAKMSSFSSDFQTLVERVPATVKCCLEASPLTSTPPLPVIASTYLYIKKYLRL